MTAHPQEHDKPDCPQTLVGSETLGDETKRVVCGVDRRAAERDHLEIHPLGLDVISRFSRRAAVFTQESKSVSENWSSRVSSPPVCVVIR